jgi:prepilin-type N-terminal cleavage/methylation domain-containing protein
MYLFNVRNNRADRGFTLLEILVVLVLFGILSAIATPSFLSGYNRMKLDTALNDLRGALEESQRQAIQQGRSCDVKINETTVGKITSSCLITGSRTLDSAVSISPSTSTTITFSFKGNTTNTQVFILSLSDGSNSQEKRCLAISDGVGILRTGVYENSTSTCKAKL